MTVEPAPLIDVIVESPPWDASAEAVVRRALTEAAVTVGADFKNRTFAVLLTDDASMRRLNTQWRGIDKPTNVLSFPAAPGTSEYLGAVKSLGDIAIAYETTAREAADEDKPFDHHLAHLAVHGFLHLLGYDHQDDAAAMNMEQRERTILARLGVPDPYRAQEHAAVRDLQAVRS